MRTASLGGEVLGVSLVTLLFTFAVNSLPLGSPQEPRGGQDAPVPSDLQTPDAEPIPEEALLLEYINRFRADPISEIDRIVTPPYPRRPHPEIDWERFRREMLTLVPAPPLVFNPRLVLAARNHTQYVIATRDYGHDEVPGKPGFSGSNAGIRCAFVGFDRSTSLGECTVGHAQTVWGIHWGMILDDGPGLGGMQESRGHRLTTIASFHREYGAGILPHPPSSSKRTLCATELFASRGVGRLAGGVTFLDLNENDFYDIGEGVGGVVIRGGEGARCRSWGSGAYSLELGTSGAVEMTAEFLGFRRVQKFDSGSANLKFDFDLWDSVQPELEGHLASVDGLQAGESLPFKAAIDLLFLLDALPIPEEFRKRCEPLIASVRIELFRAQDALLEALDAGGSFSFRQALRMARLPYEASRAAPWFQSVDRLARIASDIKKLEAKFRPVPTAVSALLDRVEAEVDENPDERIQVRLDEMRKRVTALRK